MKIIIHENKECAWCEANGNFIYGKNRVEVENALNIVYTKSELISEQSLSLSCNR